MAAPIDGQTCHPNHPAGKTVLQHRTPVISERLSKSDGFCDRQSLQLRWDDFFSLVSRPTRRFIFPAKPLVPTGTAFTACPAYRFPVIPGRLNFLRWCHHTSSRCAARTCRLPGFYFWFYSGGIYLVIYKTGNSIFLWWIYLFSYERTIILSSLSWHSWIWTSGLFVLSWTLWLCKFYPARIFSA